MYQIRLSQTAYNGNEQDESFHGDGIVVGSRKVKKRLFVVVVDEKIRNEKLFMVGRCQLLGFGGDISHDTTRVWVLLVATYTYSTELCF